VRHSITTYTKIKCNKNCSVLNIPFRNENGQPTEFETHPAVILPNLLHPEPLPTTITLSITNLYTHK